MPVADPPCRGGFVQVFPSLCPRTSPIALQPPVPSPRAFTLAGDRQGIGAFWGQQHKGRSEEVAMGRRDVSQGEQLTAPQSQCGEVAKTQHKACDRSYSSPSTLCVPLPVPQQVSLVLGSAGISWMLNEALSDSSNGCWKFPCITPGWDSDTFIKLFIKF